MFERVDYAYMEVAVAFVILPCLPLCLSQLSTMGLTSGIDGHILSHDGSWNENDANIIFGEFMDNVERANVLAVEG